MKFAMCLETEVGPKWVHARQMGVDHAIVLGPPTGAFDLTQYGNALKLKKQFEDAGLNLAGVEGLIPMDAMKAGTAERETQIEQFCQIIRNLGAVEIPVLCYSWMVFFTWARTSFTTRGRGGALVSSYEHHLTERAPGANQLRITEDKLWETFEYFLRRVVPVAEKAGVRLTLHPDDPPLSPVMGVSRIFGRPENYDRAMAMIESEANAICFCQANFGLMDGPERVPELIRHFGKRIGFVHFRDVRGERRNFVETFHDEGHTDMFACMQAYRDIGFDGPIRPDHAPAMEGDPNIRPGYEALGRLFAIGYMKGLLEGVDATRRTARPAG
ncbi:MAG: mannonate dehydratase [Acidisphaera sp.]|nr:mannonate dehydratase [Acidisphaera sp.]MBV9811936.1 mannonate dehydratase [Acetobacteraceae bacterium]